MPINTSEITAVTVYENNPTNINTTPETKVAKQAFNNEKRHFFVQYRLVKRKYTKQHIVLMKGIKTSASCFDDNFLDCLFTLKSPFVKFLFIGEFIIPYFFI